MKSIFLIGNGGHAKVIKDIINQSEHYTFKGYLDDNINKFYEENNIVYDRLDNISNYVNDHYFIISIGDNKVREIINIKLNLPSEQYPILVHPSSCIGSNVEIGNGTVVMANTVINADTVVGKHSIINTGAIVEHDNIISDFVHVSPNSTLTGGVSVGIKSQIGASATVIPQIRIGQNTIVGAGSTVVNDIGDNQIVVGTPAKPIRR
ncbi:acetyltransferase [Staphylococcus hominis]|uniref:Acetyltransferase n=1 Tax=Staphylococcus hominis TaxID=1290 RepID=A0A8X8KIQ6_STAHO|nr:acetyltransferase [Staphylococcus hominis]MBK1407231.1 acetyltransferase [Staphylococcus hominis]MCM5673275.1 acetyltransferase [Staphylococcus hominis]PNZ82158.1 acetyltransferase [Staphylococcus hominis subsp. novobiosepticus]